MLLDSVFSGLDTIGFSGSRSLSGAGLAVLASLFPLVPAGCHIVVGCAAGADLAVRSAFDDGRLCLFAVDSGRFGTGRAAFARRSVAIVEALPLGGKKSGYPWLCIPSSWRYPFPLLPWWRLRLLGFCCVGSWYWAAGAAVVAF
jgi:hypothetical protein